MKKIIITLGVLVVLAIAWWLISPIWRTVELNEELPTSTVESNASTTVSTSTGENNETIVIARGVMIPDEHEVEGEALYIKSDGKNYLRFENLNTVNGPDLRIYLSADKESKDFIDIGPIKATKGNVNYEIPSNVDLTKYKYAVIWCKGFRVSFSYAELN